MKKFNYKKNYHNNVFNAKISSLLDNYRSICDFDFVLRKDKCKRIIAGDHKKGGDKMNQSTLKTYSRFVSDDVSIYIVYCNICEDTGVFEKCIIKEVKSASEIKREQLKDKKNLQYFYKDVFELRTDDELKMFFSVELHDDFKEKLKKQRLF